MAEYVKYISKLSLLSLSYSAVHTPIEPPPPYYAVMGVQQPFPYTQTTTEQQRVTA